REALPDPVSVLPLGNVVELGPQRRRELVDEADEIDPSQRAPPPGRELRQPAKDDEVTVDHWHDAGSAHLHDDLTAVREASRVHLADRRGGNRLLPKTC